MPITVAKTTCVVFSMLFLIVNACTRKYDITNHFDPTLPFEIIDQGHPSGVLFDTQIIINEPKHSQLLSWLNSNNNDWKKTDDNTQAALIIVRQGAFSLLFYRDNDFVISGYNNEEKVMQQYIRNMDSHELRFLIKD